MVNEQETRKLQLQLKDSQLRNSMYAIASVLLLSLILLYGFHRQRKQKSALAKQNTLIEQQAEQLKQLDKTKSRFFANVSHELRTPISLIMGPINTILKRNQLGQEDQQLLNLARKGVENIQFLINEILDLGKMESGKMELEKAPVHLPSFFKQYFAQFESLKYSKSISYSYEILLPENSTVLLDQEKCRQIIFNLLSNAFKFTPSNGQVKATVQMIDTQLQFSVSDTGKGIHSSDLPHIFDRYFQTNRTDAVASGGTGIGLALCKEYAKLFGGKISVGSKLGEGSVFTVEFPVELADNDSLTVDLPDDLDIGFEDIQEQSGQFQAATPLLQPSMNPPKPKLLVVEDNVELQTYLQLILQHQYEVSIAENGQAAMGHLDKNGHPDLIISDLMMPVMDGYQLLKNLKGNPATQQIPAIMLTARAEKDNRLKALRIGVDDYLTKPFDEEELLARIHNLLANQSARKQAAIEEESQIAAREGLPKIDQEWLESLENYIRENLSNNQFTASNIADEFAMSSSTLLRQLKRLTGLTPRKYLSEIRLDAARQLMVEGRFRSVARVAREVGFRDVRGFSKKFAEKYGKNPSEILNN
jgi:signal transduction histidine kinase/DNA-binding response OmpR family regulator